LGKASPHPAGFPIFVDVLGRDEVSRLVCKLDGPVEAGFGVASAIVPGISSAIDLLIVSSKEPQKDIMVGIHKTYTSFGVLLFKALAKSLVSVSV
jgi:hypothetical protein